MSAIPVDKALARCRAAAIRTVWRQWSVLGGQVGGHFKPPDSVVDPEALLLMSCFLRDDEPRLWDIAAGFVANGSTLLSVQRTRNMAAMFPESVKPLLGEVAAIAVTLAKDARWRPLATDEYRPFREGKVTDSTRKIAEGGALIARLRMAFGVHARTDALAFLIASAPSAATAREVADATCYGEMPVRRALAAIAKSRIIVSDGERPERYHVEDARWAPLLHVSGGFPAWRHWHAIFAFLTAAFHSTQATTKVRTDYLISSHARRVVLEHWNAFVLNRISVPQPADYPGEEFLRGYIDTLASVEKWLETST